MMRQRLTDEFLTKIAEAYNEHALVRRPAAPSIAEAFQVPVHTAQRWITAARKRGFLPADASYRPLFRPHGVGAYIDRKCRCAMCCEAYREYRRDERQKMAEAASRGEAAFEHGEHGYINWGCRCDVCASANLARQRASYAADQAETLESASRRGQQWTGPEIEVAARTDLTTKQAALALGRTYGAVRAMRHKIRSDPKIIHLAGLDRAARQRTSD